MAPKPECYLCPWLCVERDADGAALKWDLTQWDDAYWARLRDFVAAAEERGVVVEYVLFCFFYTDTLWQASPMHPANNVNGLTVADRNSPYTLENTRSAGAAGRPGAKGRGGAGRLRQRVPSR